MKIKIKRTKKDWTTNKRRDYWADPKWFKARNRALVRDKKRGMRGIKLMKKYNMTYPAIHRILKSYENKKNEK